MRGVSAAEGQPAILLIAEKPVSVAGLKNFLLKYKHCSFSDPSNAHDGLYLLLYPHGALVGQNGNLVRVFARDMSIRRRLSRAHG